MEQIAVIPVSPGFGPGFGDDLFSLPPPDLVCLRTLWTTVRMPHTRPPRPKSGAGRFPLK